MESVTAAYLFEQLGRLYVLTQTLRDEAERQKLTADSLKKTLAVVGNGHRGEPVPAEEVTPSPTT